MVFQDEHQMSESRDESRIKISFQVSSRFLDQGTGSVPGTNQTNINQSVPSPALPLRPLPLSAPLSPPPFCSPVSSPLLLRLLLTNSGSDNADSESAQKFEFPGQRKSTLTTSDIMKENTQQHLWRLRPQPTISLDLNQTSQNHKPGPGGSSLLTEPLQNQNQNLPGTRCPAWTNAARTGLSLSARGQGSPWGQSQGSPWGQEATEHLRSDSFCWTDRKRNGDLFKVTYRLVLISSERLKPQLSRTSAPPPAGDTAGQQQHCKNRFLFI